MPRSQRNCSTCGRTFAHNTHLRRHETSHRENANSCQFCGKRFGRRDVTRRHAQSCAQRGEGDTIRILQRGRRSKACEKCAESKLGCDGQTPCGRCSGRGLQCSYTLTTHLRRDAGSTRGEPVALDRDGVPARGSFFFAVTDPTLQSASEFLATDEPGEVPARSSQWDRMQQDRRRAPSPDFGLLFMGFGGIPGNAVYSGWDLPSGASDDDLTRLWFDGSGANSNLQNRIDQLNYELKQLQGDCSRPGVRSISPYDAHFQEADILQCASSFFRHKHWQWPVIHWPSFDPETATLPLLLAIYLTGAAFTRPEDDVQGCCAAARACYETAEAYIFKHLEALMPSQLCTTAVDSIQICQAALLIESLQSSVNDGITRQRIVTTRHPSLVATVRSLEFTGTRHSHDQRGWDEFVQTESIIRLVTWTFLNDALLPLACSQPPSMAVSEMAGDLPCDEEVWDASNETEFEERWALRCRDRQALSMRGLVEGLMDDNWSAPPPDCYGNLNGAQLYIVLWALQPSVFALRAGMFGRSCTGVIARAVGRWTELWKDATRYPGVSQRNIAVAKHAPELAWLTTKILDAIETGEGRSSSYIQGIAHVDTWALHQFIGEHLPVVGI